MTFFQGEKVVLNSASLRRRSSSAEMPKEQAWFLPQSAWCWGLVRNVWLKQVIQNLLVQYCGRGVNKWCLTFCWTFFDWVPRLLESCENIFIDSSLFALRNNYQYFQVPEQKQVNSFLNISSWKGDIWMHSSFLVRFGMQCIN